MNSVNKRVVVITGASSGIGRATALMLAKRGDTVVLAARDAEALQELAEECEQVGGHALAVDIDVAVEQQVNQLARQALYAFDRIDVWINNAAVNTLGRFEDIPTADIHRLLEVNLMGTIHGTRAVLPHFKARGEGILINVASMVALTGQPFAVPYSISKFGIRGLSLSLAQELANQPDIHVCTVLPAVIDTPIFNHAANYMGRAAQAPKPVVRAEEVAKAITKLTRHPKKEVIVGNMARMNRAWRALAPDMFDKQFHKMIDSQHFQDEPQAPTSGNLYVPDRELTTISGGWKDKPGQEGKSSGLKRAAQVTAGAAAISATYLLATAFLNRKKEPQKLLPAATAATNEPVAQTVATVQQAVPADVVSDALATAVSGNHPAAE
ncbi:SDR family oxidoreductase [Hymenobacter cellulosilyticus]|uniref:SDR family oxidoreductase n=1 Tax=Hymenobacter cellulosilyticus TaxID=2932248 RepID=A0A8T9Q7Z8_9BACT|nr:SDR family oxidoreductase [Hymenobacter cellulosilyticus]UOQ73062.1 SDR family oxidoreductase [Hymenobacter cellulosilyticus]